MDRKQFLKNIGIGAAAMAILPVLPDQQVVKEEISEKLLSSECVGQVEWAGDGFYLCVDNSNKTGLQWKRIES